MFQKHTLGVVFSLVILLSGCGQKGDLYMPSKETQSQEAVPETKIEQQKKQKSAPTEENKLSEQDASMP